MLSFNNFREFLTDDKISEIGSRANISASCFRENMSITDPGYVDTQIAAMSMTMSIEMLNLYHEWLSKQLSDQ